MRSKINYIFRKNVENLKYLFLHKKLACHGIKAENESKLMSSDGE